MNASLLLGLIILLGVVALPALFRMVVKGKIYCLFIEDDGYVKGALKKPMFNNEYIIDEEGAYDIISDRVGLTTFPRGLPSFFQSILPCIIYRRDDPVPIEINNPTSRPISAKEVRVGLEPHFIKNLVMTSREGGGESRLQRMLPLLSVAAIGMVLILIFVVLVKMGTLEKAIQLIP